MFLYSLPEEIQTMPDDNILTRIPGEYISRAAKTLPDAEDVQDPFLDVTIALPEGTTACITFRRFHQTKIRNRRWFWTAEKAVPV